MTTVDRARAVQRTPDPALGVPLDGLLASETFRRSDRLTALLLFLVSRARDGHAEPVKEYELGVEVFGRPVTYDPRTDPIARVGVRELRMKLAAYYGAEGAADLVRIAIPKGSYRVVVSSFPAASEPPAVVADEAISGRPWTFARRWLAVAVAVGLVALIWGFRTSRVSPTSPAVAATPSVAVLPFVNLTGDSRLDYFSDGVTDEIIAALMTLDGLLVTGRTSVFSLKGTGENPQEIGRKLGVEAILSGSVRLAADRIRISARLTKSDDGFELWSRTIEAKADDPTSVQINLAGAVADALRIRLDPTSGQAFIKRSNDDPEAHDLYLRARHLAHTREAAKVAESITLFEQAVARDPGFAVAHVGLADAHEVLAFNGQTEPGAGVAKARTAAARALALDPTLGEALAHLAHLSAFVDWDWSRAEEQFRRAIALTPSHPRIHAWFGQTLVVQGRFEEGLHELLVARRLDPLASSIVYALGEAYLYAGQYEDARRVGREMVQMNEQSWGGRNLLARASLADRQPVAAAAALERSRGELWADSLRLVALGDSKGARDLVDRRRESLAATQPLTIASLYASAGDIERALTWLERAFAVRQTDIVVLAVDPAFAGLHNAPRFRALVGQLRLSGPRLPTASR